jgi:methylglutaconyl-CoA hydratase
MKDLVLLEAADCRATITLNRPDARNALNPELVEALRRAVADLDKRRDISVCVVRGAGRVFCAGMDLKVVQTDPEAMGRLLQAFSRLLLDLRRLPMVTVAAVHRAAIGGGCGLATVCDFAVGHEDAKVGYPEVDLGLSPAAVAPWLVRKIGAGSARTLLLQGGTMSGREAFEAGLLSHVSVNEASMSDVLNGVVDRLVSAGPQAIRATKQWLNELDGSLDAAVCDRGAAISAEIAKGEEAQRRLAERFGG